MNVLWRIELFGGLKLSNQDRVVTRFQTYKTSALLAYLSSHWQIVPRDVLVELLWPDAELDAGRNSLRVALNSLRRQIEPPGVPAGTVLITDRTSVQLNREVITTDVLEFEALLQKSSRATEEAAQKVFLLQAVSCYQGSFLSGYYEDWIAPERLRLSDAYAAALRRLTRLLVQAQELDNALDIARRALVADPLHEASHRNLMQLYVALGKPSAAAQQYRELETLLREQLGADPSDATRALVRKLALDIDQPSPVLMPTLPAPASPNAEVEERPLARSQTLPVQEGFLPPQLTRFFGREAEITWIEERFAEQHTRVITLTGPGGIGKTRLAIEAAEHLRPAFQQRIWFVALAEVTDSERFIGAIASSLRLERQPETVPMQQIVRTLTVAPALLLLDNLEQVVDTGAEVVETLLAQAPGLSMLVTSRQPLGVSGEQEMPVSLLAAPSQTDSIADLLNVPAVHLFLDRAQSVRPDFQITPRNAEAVVALCVRLEGLPLAIELAAAWAQSLTPAQMLERLNTRFELLVSSRKDRSPRHRTLRAAIDWSYHLLEPALQTFLARLALFQGGWTLEAAQTVCVEPQALTLLQQLQQRSLLSTEDTPEQMRFRMLAMIREYASERLSDKERCQLQSVHARYYRQLLQQSAFSLQQADAPTTLRLLEAESENVHAALAWYVEQGAWAEAIEMGAILWRFWYETAQVARGRNWLERLCTEAKAKEFPEPTGAALFYGAGRLAATQNDLLRAEIYFEQCLLRARRTANREQQTHALANLVLMAGARGDTQAVITYLAESLDLKRQEGHRWKLAYGISALAEAHLQHGDYAAAHPLFVESVALRREIGDSAGCAEAQLGLSQTLSALGRQEQAAQLELEARALRQRLDESSALSASFLNLGTMAWEQGDYRVAHSLFNDVLTLFEESRDRPACAFVLKCLAEIALRQHDLHTARALCARSLHLRRELGDIPGIVAALHFSGELASADNDLFASEAFLREERRLLEKDAVKSVKSV